jgi:hypothetical protein
MSISHKKMKEIKDTLNQFLNNDEVLTEKIYESLKVTLNYNEDKKYEYDKDKYEKYSKPYYEKNKDKIKKAVTERRRNKRIEEKKDIQNIENSLNIIKI